MQSTADNFAAKMKRIGALVFTALFVFQAVSPAVAQYNNNAWLQQQRMQQQQQAAQRQQEQMRRQQEQQAQMQRQQQMQAQQQRIQQQQQAMQRQQQAQQQQQAAQRQQQAQQQQAAQRQQAIQNQQRQNQGSQQRYQQQVRTPQSSAPTTAIRGQPNRNVSASEGRGFVSSAGIAKLTKPLTPGEIKKGFTGKVLGDGRGLVKYQGRIFAVPAASISGLVRKPANQNVAESKFTALQRQQVNARLAGIVTGSKVAKPSLDVRIDKAMAGPRSASVYHATSSPQAVTGILKGINPAMLSPNSRFGKAFYVAEVPDTSLAELGHHKVVATHGIRMSLNLEKAKVLDLTDRQIADRWGYSGGPVSQSTISIGNRASSEGYSAIKFPSERGSGANYAVIGDFDNVLSAEMVTPVNE